MTSPVRHEGGFFHIQYAILEFIVLIIPSEYYISFSFEYFGENSDVNLVPICLGYSRAVGLLPYANYDFRLIKGVNGGVIDFLLS